jgi:hypothetical protein
MADIHETSCEIKVFGGWQPITLDEALRSHPSRLKRCPVCHGQVRAHAAGKDGIIARFEHFQRNPGCYLVPGIPGAKTAPFDAALVDFRLGPHETARRPHCSFQ